MLNLIAIKQSLRGQLLFRHTPRYFFVIPFHLFRKQDLSLKVTQNVDTQFPMRRKQVYADFVSTLVQSFPIEDLFYSSKY